MPGSLLPAASLLNTGAGMKSALMATRSSDVAYAASNTFYSVAWNGSLLDRNGDLNVSNGEYTIPETGYYVMCFSATIGHPSTSLSDANLNLEIRRNGTSIAFSADEIDTKDRFNNPRDQTIRAVIMHSFTAGDVITCWLKSVSFAPTLNSDNTRTFLMSLGPFPDIAHAQRVYLTSDDTISSTAGQREIDYGIVGARDIDVGDQYNFTTKRWDFPNNIGEYYMTVHQVGITSVNDINGDFGRGLASYNGVIYNAPAQIKRWYTNTTNPMTFPGAAFSRVMSNTDYITHEAWSLNSAPRLARAGIDVTYFSVLGPIAADVMFYSINGEGDTVMSADTWTEIPLGVGPAYGGGAQWDDGSGYDAVNQNFKAPQAGWYLVAPQLAIRASTRNNQFTETVVRKNDTTAVLGIQGVEDLNFNYTSGNIMGLIELDVGDTLSIWGWIQNGSNTVEYRGNSCALQVMGPF